MLKLILQIIYIGDVSYKYFIEVVATDVKKAHSNAIKTYQYSAKDIQKTVNSGE